MDRHYNVPSYHDKIAGANLDGIQRESPRIKNFLTIIKVLSEGKCTASELALHDGYSDHKKKRLNRQKMYSRIIEEDTSDEQKDSLLSLGIIQIAGTVMTSKRTKQYELSVLGIFYALHLFVERTGKINFLDTLAFNYKHLLPLVFGKWKLTKEFGKDLEMFVELADGIEPMMRSTELDNPLVNVAPIAEETSMFIDFSTIRYPERRAEFPSYFAQEITLWFFALQLDSIHTDEWKRMIMKDEEIHSWYYHYITKLLERERQNLREVRYVKELITKKKRTRS